MSNAAQSVEQDEGAGLDAMLDEYQHEEAEAERLENQPTKEEMEKAKALAAKFNSGFLWTVNKTQCPHVDIDQIVNREKGDEAFLGLAKKFDGEIPPWMAALEPYIAAGVYMGVTISQARSAEAQVIEHLKQKQAEQASQGAANGDEPES